MIKDYKFLEHTASLCHICLKKADAKIIEKDGSVYILKFCQEHGEFCEILEEDADYYNQRKQYDKPGNACICQTERAIGCPFDCGICPSHEQHSCISLIEITNRCNLNCPICFANSGKGDFMSKEEFEQRLDFLVESEGGQADILQISGGEPTLHPEIISFIELARSKKINYVMLNTNGLKLSEDIQLAEALSRFKGGFEIYLQFDGLNDKTHTYFRGQPLKDIKLKAIRNLQQFNIPITLVTTLERGINDNETGKIIEFGLSTNCIRGISFQPVGYFGRLPASDPANRLTLTGIIRKIEEQTSGMVRKSDFIPLPCNVDRVAITYFYRNKHNSFVPLTRNLDLKKYLPFIKNTFKFDPDDFLKELSSGIFSKECCDVAGLFKDFAKLIPMSYVFKSEDEKIKYVNENTFRISITSFIDAYNFDIKSAQKECVHFIVPGSKKIPFSMYNLLHRK
jgi:7,8-dihydro-6-hydroxymethylpterin dimethyltransferase